MRSSSGLGPFGFFARHTTLRFEKRDILPKKKSVEQIKKNGSFLMGRVVYVFVLFKIS